MESVETETPAQTLARVMEERGLKDAEVAAAAGYDSADTVYRWRTGRTEFTPRKLAKVLRALEDRAPAWFRAHQEEQRLRHEAIMEELGRIRRKLP